MDDKIKLIKHKLTEALKDFKPGHSWMEYSVEAIMRIIYACICVVAQKLIKESFVKSAHIPPAGTDKDDWDILQAKLANMAFFKQPSSKRSPYS